MGCLNQAVPFTYIFLCQRMNLEPEPLYCSFLICSMQILQQTIEIQRKKYDYVFLMS